MTSAHPTSTRLTDELKRDLKRIADHYRWSLAKTIQIALVEWTAHRKVDIEKLNKRRKA